jgi:hypothetical protein
MRTSAQATRFGRVALAQRGDGLAQEMLFDCGHPGQVVGAGGLGDEQLPDLAAREGAEHHVGHGGDAVACLAHQAGLQAEEGRRGRRS